MGRAIAVKTDYSGAEVRRLAKRTKDAAQARRLLAIAAILDGASREEAANTGGMDRQTLRDWVIRFNEQGPDGLINIASPGAPAKLDEEHKAFLARIADEGPTPAIHGVVRWRACDLIMRLYEEFTLSVSDDTIYRAMKELGFSHVSARPKAYKQDAEAIDAFKKRMARPGASGFFDWAVIGLLQRIRPRTKPRPRWRYARPGPHKLFGVERRFFNQVSRTPFDCQAISFPPLANTVSSSAPQVRRSAAD